MLQTMQEDWIVGELVSIQWDIFQQNLAMFRTQNVTTHCSGLWTGLQKNRMTMSLWCTEFSRPLKEAHLLQ